MSDWETHDATDSLDIAVIGLAGRFPNAKNIQEFWQNLKDGVEAISFFTDQEVQDAGIDPELVKNPHYVKAGAVLEDVDLFDASFFGFYPREAALMDPQQRVFLEIAWEALERAGYDAELYDGLIGVFAGMSMNTYLLFNLYSNLGVAGSADIYPLAIGNDKDFLPTRVSYKLNLRGPSINVQTACSTSLVASHLACQSLLNYQCDMALAGGVSINLPQKRGYLYQEGGIASPDGHCRAFADDANGTVGGNGVGIVVLKRLSDALADGDHIHAVIKGSAINNDGSLKIGYTAPSVDGQAEVIAMAQAVGEVDPETIGYIETHGTGTNLGDPIEIEALTQVFRASTQEKGFCALGSVKTNLGHLDAAAGVAGLIKATLALEHKQIPPSLHFERPNPRIDFANSPFFVNAQLRDWDAPAGDMPRRAGVSSFGIGGTNAHVVLEQAPVVESSGASRDWQLLLLSARTPTALDAATGNLAAHLQQHPDLNLADVAYTYQVGRKTFDQRRMLVCRDLDDALDALENLDPQRVFTGVQEAGESPVAFMFTGQGAQYVNMTRELYQKEPLFREHVDNCAELLQPHLNFDLRDMLYPDEMEAQEVNERLKQTYITQPALFVVEYALAQLWISWGVQPGAMIGHSIGEYTAACLAGVFELKDALALVAARGRMMQGLPGGAMLSVPMTEDQVRPFLNGKVSLATINAPTLCVVSGPHDDIEDLEQRLAEQGVDYRRLHTSHAFHSPMMEPILDAFAQRVAQANPAPPQIPFVSNVTGTWITADEATDPRYWARHLRHAVRFADGVGVLLEDPDRIFLEVGPGRTLSSLTRRHPDARGRTILSSLRHPKDQQSDVAFVLNTLGRLWMSGARVDWSGFYTDERRLRVPLPTYPFERQRYWVEPTDSAPLLQARSEELGKRTDLDTWFYAPSWKRADLPSTERQDAAALCWLVFGDESDLSAGVVERLVPGGGQDVVVVKAGDYFDGPGERLFTINPEQEDDYVALLSELAATSQFPDRIVHLWNATSDEIPFDQAQTQGFYSLLRLARALGEQGKTVPVEIAVVTAGVQEVTGEEALSPARATLLGPCKVIPQEYPHLTCRNLDVSLSSPGMAGRIAAELTANANERVVAYRGKHRWIQTFEPLPQGAFDGATQLRKGGVYLITGGLGRIGLALAEHLAEAVRAKLVLLDRFDFPAQDAWGEWLKTHDKTDGISLRIGRLQAIAALGAEVVVASADVTDLAQMAAVIDDAYARFGALHGVIHAAGLVGEASLKMIQETGAAEAEAQFQAKAHGLTVLEKVLRDKTLDFCLLQSSLSTILGGLGMAAYAAANAFMDIFAHWHNQDGAAPWISVNWDGWRFAEEQGVGAALVDLAMTPQEGIAAFERAMALKGFTQVVVSTGDLRMRIEKWVEREAPEEGARAVEEGSSLLFPRPQLQTAYVAPRNDLEETLAVVWQNILGIEQVGVYDDFFELGGHSLLATQIVSRLRDTYQVDLPLRKLFESPTVAGLVTLIQEGLGATKDAAGLAIAPVSRDGVLPLSSGQGRLWFLDQLEPGSPLYNNFAAVRLSGVLDVPLLERCINEIVRRHESLRTTFEPLNGQPTQVIAPELTLPLQLVDLSHLTETEQEKKIHKLAIEEARKPFDLTQGPLKRLTLLRLGKAEHVIFMTAHHIISDGWSVVVLIQELAALYAAFSAGNPSPLPEMTIQYADYAHWQQEWLQGETIRTQLVYWQEKLGYDPPPLDLPTDRPRPAIQTSNGANYWFDLPPSLRQALDDLGQGDNATLFMTLTAALGALLHRYSGQEDISIGTPIANRNRSETEGLIGFLLNTLVVRADLSGEITFRELLGRVRETALGAYAHQDVPFEMLVQALQPERDMSRSPLFQVMFDLQIAPLEKLELPGLTLSPLQTDNGTAKFDLALSMEYSDERLGGFLNYNTDLFDAATVERIVGHFQKLLESIVADPDQDIVDLPLLTEAERERLLTQWNQSAVVPHVYQSISELFEAQVDQRPGDVALILENKKLTYAELNRRANQLAHHLYKLGVGPESIVGLLVERSIEAVVGILGTLKAGGAYLPLDPTNPPERLAFMLTDARVPVVLTQSHLAEQIDGAQVVCLDDAGAFAQESAKNPEAVARPEDLAYVIYTSGSTGVPKGVLITHENIAIHCLDVCQRFQLTPDDRVLQFSAYVFDQSIEQILATLITGATLVLRGPEVWPPADLGQVVADYGLTVVNLPPAYWNQWVQDWGKCAVANEQLRLVISGGDVVPPDSLRLWFASPLREARLLNAYGPTETTITALTHTIPADLAGNKVPIGRPLANRTIYILDKRGNPTPVGVPGELHIGGAGLARGYLNQPGLTAERFIDDPFAPPRSPPQAGGTPPEGGQGGARLYKTGDLVRFLPDGAVEFLGRVDHQVKIRGFRIELGEIEATLNRHPATRQVAVVVREDIPGDKRLMAYLVLDGETQPPTGELRAFVKERLPDYMAPSVFVWLDALPLTASGKINRRALPAPDASRPDLADTFVAPRTPLEEELAAMWAEVLNVEQVGVHDSFFDLGGHSLMATQLIARVRANYQVDLPLRRLFERATVSGLATLIAEGLAEQASEDELAQLLAELEGLSEDQVQELLAQD